MGPASSGGSIGTPRHAREAEFVVSETVCPSSRVRRRCSAAQEGLPRRATTPEMCVRGSLRGLAVQPVGIRLAPHRSDRPTGTRGWGCPASRSAWLIGAVELGIVVRLGIVLGLRWDNAVDPVAPWAPDDADSVIGHDTIQPGRPQANASAGMARTPGRWAGGTCAGHGPPMVPAKVEGERRVDHGVPRRPCFRPDGDRRCPGWVKRMRSVNRTGPRLTEPMATRSLAEGQETADGPFARERPCR
jgi:hypothetical protein